MAVEPLGAVTWATDEGAGGPGVVTVTHTPEATDAMVLTVTITLPAASLQ